MYDPIVNGRHLRFGISGLLYQSTAVLYDRRTESLWSQVGSAAISGAYQGQRLRKVAARDTTWGAWRGAHPDSLVLSEYTGYDHNYGLNMYAAVQLRNSAANPTYPVAHGDDRLAPQTQVLGLEVNGASKAYPVSALRHAPARFSDTVGGATLQITNHPPGAGLIVRDAEGTEIPVQSLYWFAWAAFFPATDIYALPADATGAQPAVAASPRAAR